jgi:hypothetical protein
MLDTGYLMLDAGFWVIAGNSKGESCYKYPVSSIQYLISSIEYPVSSIQYVCGFLKVKIPSKYRRDHYNGWVSKYREINFPTQY